MNRSVDSDVYGRAAWITAPNDDVYIIEFIITVNPLIEQNKHIIYNIGHVLRVYLKLIIIGQ